MPHPKSLFSWRTGEFLAIVATSLGLALLLLARTELMLPGTPDFAKPWDHQKYIQMALESPLDFHQAPFCWRVAVPVLASVLPFGLNWDFLAITVVSVWLTAVALYYLARQFGFSRPLSLCATILFLSMGWATKFTFHDFWLVDPLSFLFITLAIYCVVTRKDFGFALLLAAGVTAKESVLFVAPLYYSFHARQALDARLAGKTFLLALPAICVLISLRMIIAAPPSEYSYWAILTSLGVYRLESLGSLQLLGEYTVYAFGLVVMLLPFVMIAENKGLFLKFLPFLILIYSQLIFSINTERLIVAGFPAMIILSINTLRALSKRFALKEQYWLVLPALSFVLLLRRPDQTSPQLEVQLVAIVLALGLIALLTYSHNLWVQRPWLAR